MSPYATWFFDQIWCRNREHLSYVRAMKDKMLRSMAGKIIAGEYR